MRAYQPSLQEPEAFSNLYERTYIILFRFIYGMLGGPVEEVEDLTCETYFRAWKARMRFSGVEQDAVSWLFTIARHLVIDAHRHRKARREELEVRLDDAAIESILPSAQETPEDKAAQREQIHHLWHFLQDLPVERREMLVLRYMLGWKVNEIAKYMHKEENTISVYIKRSLEEIRNRWPAE